MGVYIAALKVGEQCKANESSEDEVYIFCLPGFEPIEQITMFEIGKWYHTSSAGDSYLHMPCSSFNRFRGIITQHFYGMNYLQFCDCISFNDIKEPFKEMLWFADNEGCFDYVIAEKLIKDFETYRTDILVNNESYSDIYDTYLNILKECVNVKGIVEYK